MTLGRFLGYNRRMMGGLLAAMMLGGCDAPIPKTVVEPRTISGSYPRGEALLKQAMLARHAAARAEVGEAPLLWDDALAASAAVYATTLVSTGVFRHADQAQGEGREGEALFRGTRGDYSYREMVDLWIAEKADFINGETPFFSKTGRGEDVGHYTQIIWHSTTHVGCALKSSPTDDYLVCRYSPPGNVVGERAL
jgi:hypothetical protein